MIFVTVGTQLPFDRLINAVDVAAAELSETVFGQIGPVGYRPRNFQYVSRATATEMDGFYQASRVIVAHAGTGTILKAQSHQRPLILFPRRVEFREHRNDHQIATCRSLGDKVGIYVAWTVEDLELLLSDQTLVAASEEEARHGREQFLSRLSQLIQG